MILIILQSALVLMFLMAGIEKVTLVDREQRPSLRLAVKR